ncbi:unnamed protein product, partial [Mesorhabditis spiculigera]
MIRRLALCILLCALVGLSQANACREDSDCPDNWTCLMETCYEFDLRAPSGGKGGRGANGRHGAPQGFGCKSDSDSFFLGLLLLAVVVSGQKRRWCNSSRDCPEGFDCFRNKCSDWDIGKRHRGQPECKIEEDCERGQHYVQHFFSKNVGHLFILRADSWAGDGGSLPAGETREAPSGGPAGGWVCTKNTDCDGQFCIDGRCTGNQARAPINPCGCSAGQGCYNGVCFGMGHRVGGNVRPKTLQKRQIDDYYLPYP